MDDARPYPVAWEADVVLADGGVAHVRPISRDDMDRLEAFHGRLSPQTVYYRYFAPRPRLSRRDLEWLTDVDHDRRVAFVATLRGELLAVVRYDRIDVPPPEGAPPSVRPSDVPPGTAEVAFIVRDDQQGRGLGGILLEHLAAAAAERGVRRFVAEVLPENRRMLATFRAAGYELQRQLDEGTVHVEFDLTPTAESEAVSRAREHRAEARSISRLLTPRAVAVVGAGREPGNLGHLVFRNLLAGGFTGPVHPVNPGVSSVAGVRAWPSLSELPDDVDLAVVAVPAPQVLDVVREAADKGVHALVVLSAGFSETGPDGAEAERELVRLARDAGMRVVGPGCLGVLTTDPAVRLNATLAPELPAEGPVAMFSQSGGLGTAIAAEAARRGLGLSSFVSAGNRADVSGNDLLQYWEDDERTRVVLLYLESFGNPRKFARLSRRVARRKPVVVVRSASVAVAGRRARDETVEALFQSAGVIRTDSLSQMLDVAAVLQQQPLPPGRRMAVLGNSASLVRLAVDAGAPAGLEVAELCPDTVAAIHEVIPEGSVLVVTGRGEEESPQRAALDLGATATADDFEQVLRAVVADPGVDAVVTTFVPPLAGSVSDVAGALERVSAATEAKPVVATLVAWGQPSAAARTQHVPTFSSPEVAVAALGRVARYASWRREPEGEHLEPPDVDVEAGRAVVQRVLARAPEGAALRPSEAAELLAAYGLRVWEEVPVGSADEAVDAAEQVGWPVALKSRASSLRHREDLGGLRLDISTAPELRTAYEALGERVSALLPPGADHGVVVQAMAPRGVPCTMAVLEDPSFGPLVSFGVGGVAGDLLADRAYRTLPLTDRDVHDLVASVRGRPLLDGWRGAPPADVAAVEDVVARLARLADDLPEVAALELNPVVAAPETVSVLSAAGRIAPPSGRPDNGPRRLGDVPG